MPVDLVLRDVVPRGAAQATDLAIDEGLVVAAGPALEAQGRVELDGEGSLLLPAFVNAHQHLDKCLIGDALRAPTWSGSRPVLRAINREHRRGYTVESIVERASRVVELAIAHGTCLLRGFTDIEQTAELTGTRALLELKDRYAGEVDVQVVPFPQDLLYAGDDNAQLLEEAVALGVDAVGGMPSEEPTVELVHRHVDLCLALAKRHACDVHMLLDDSDDPSFRALEYLAWRTIKEGLEGRVVVGHVGALSAYDHTHAATVIQRVADAGISVCVNPHISLTLQGWQDRGIVRRGITRVRELLDAGVNLLAAQDDVDDPYYPLGRADLLEVAHYTAHVCHLLWPAELEQVADMVTVNAAQALHRDGYGTEVGCRADLVLLGRPTFREALADMAPRRAVVLKGRLVAETVVQARRHRAAPG